MAGNAVIFALGIAAVDGPFREPIAITIMLLLGMGFAVTGRYILRRNRVYYLQMLLKKTLLEAEFGFYEVKFSGSDSDLAFPWRLKPDAIAELKTKPDEWVERQIRGPGTVARWLFVMFETIIVIYSLLLVLLLIAWLR